MAVTIKSFPSASIQGNASNKSYWVAVHHPVVWTFQRKDFPIIDITGGDPGMAIIHLSSGNYSEAAVNDYIYIETDNRDTSGTYKILEKNDTSHWIRIAYNYISTNTHGWINYVSARKNHFLSITVYSIDNSFALTEIGTLKSVCSPAGIATANVMEYLKSLVDYKEVCTFGRECEEDKTLGGKYTIAYSESYNTITSSYGNVDYLGDHNYVNASKQVQDEYGTNMAAYVPSLLYSGAKFMSDFEKPTLFSGFPFALTFILSDKICSKFNLDYDGLDNLKKVYAYLDVNRNLISSETLDIWNANSTENVNRLVVLEDFPVNTNSIIVGVQYDDGTNHYHELIGNELKYISKCEYKNPVYLNWLGTNGGRNFWLFDLNQSDVLEVKDLGEFTQKPVDLSTDIGNGEYLGKSATPELICSAYLENADIIGLKGLLMSPDVLILTNKDNWQFEAPKWKRVKVLPQTFKVLETWSTHSEIEVTLLLPTINIQQQ